MYRRVLFRCCLQALAIANIGKYDWPENWPTLFDSLLACVTPTSAPVSPEVFDGAMRCLAFFVEYIDTSAMLEASKRLVPWMFTFLANPDTPTK